MIGPRRSVRVGTRGSQLARAQTELALARLREAWPEASTEVIVITPAGDRDKTTPLTILGGQGVFSKELHEALLDGRVDLAVHSVKDLPSELPEGVVLAAVVIRSDPRDALVSRDGSRLAELPPGARVGTSSRRRQALIRAVRPDLTPLDIRGNVDTRLRKLDQGDYDAVVLAATGLHRLGWEDRVSEYLSPDVFVPAPGQGALGVTCRAGDQELRELLGRIHDAIAGLAVEVERAFLRALGGGCQAPIGAYATVDDGQVTLRVLLGDPSLRRLERRQVIVPEEQALGAARALAVDLKGALGIEEVVRP
ncbi:hydroxymethylbilane synthase [Thermomicrobiaceae bacterium CFH 74404]|uniref:Porphobilinogen deaminase n=1 Tax=Thermalbibacter longus TaxID=2951981 RepID=A0AA41W9K1_9BACT|nr:hydroxymethylbilane synthase [Thermalbibacter longus]MCM8747747.1 hydroxymethylbilane synthase [Thermalbibacter longus]